MARKLQVRDRRRPLMSRREAAYQLSVTFGLALVAGIAGISGAFVMHTVI